MFENSHAFFICLKQLKLASKLVEWHEKVSQGRLARADNIDSSLSSSHLVNFHLSDSLVKFVLKARLQLLECNSLLHTYYPETYAKSCWRCGFYVDPISPTHWTAVGRAKTRFTNVTRLASIVVQNMRDRFPVRWSWKIRLSNCETLKITVSQHRHPLYLNTRGLTYASLIMRPESVWLLRCPCLSMSLRTIVTKVNLTVTSLCARQ